MDFIDKFREAVKIPSYWPPAAEEGNAEAEAVLRRFQELLVEQFPAFHRTAER